MSELGTLPRKTTWLLASMPALGLLLALACRPEPADEASLPRTAAPSDPSAPIVDEPVVPDPSTITASLPRVGDRFAPSLTATGEGPNIPDGVELADAEVCEGCHTEVAAQWRTSAHHFASFDNPIYRASVERFRDADPDQGFAQSRFCAGCHDPAVLVDGAMDQPVRADELRAHIGVTCRTCHTVESSTIDGNGSYTLSSRPLPIPRDNQDLAGIAEHKAAMGPARDQCASCHRAFLGPDTGHPHFLAGTDDPGPWQDSSYAGNKLRLDTKIEERNCVDCHMPIDSGMDPKLDPATDAEGKLRSHRFLGGHTWLAAMRDDPETLARAQAFLRDIASIDIAAVEVGGERHLLGRELDRDDLAGKLSVDLVVRNKAVGHRFPGGTRDAHGTWIALRVLDESGKLLAEIGEDEAHMLRVGMVDEQGRVQQSREVERFRAVAFDHTIAPRDAVVVRYGFTLDPELVGAGTLTIEARLLHRSRNLELARETCEQASTPRGKAFLAGTRKLLGQKIDPCVEPPVTEIAKAELVLGPAGIVRVSDPRPDHDRLWELGIALYHQLQERLPESRRAIEQGLAALDELEGDAISDKDRGAAKARLLAVLGAVAARQGRVDEALAIADRIAELRPDHPYPHLLRGRALAQVWRWEQAVPHLRLARAASPTSPTLASELATALGSAGRYAESFEVAAAGLTKHPRHPDLLRAQALALQALDDPRAQEALAIYFAHRSPDVAPHLGADCAELDSECARERVPVHSHTAD
ncbi:multiheme c-type cytochrome [Nannocystaceae bacterium ST9]